MADEAQNGMGFGITTETKESNNVRMLPPVKKEPTPRFPAGYHFPIAKLVNVVAKNDFETKNGDATVLQFVFKDAEGRQHIHTEWEQDPTDEHYQKKMEGLNVRLKHMYMQFFADFPEKGIGTDAKNFFEYFQAVAKAFKANPDLSKIPVFLKVTYYKGNLNFPLSPNFIQRVIKDQPCKLEVNLKYDKIEDDSSTGNGGKLPGLPGQSGGAAADDIDFDAEYD